MRGLFRSRVLWFVVGMAWLPSFKYMGRYTREPTAFEAMGWVPRHHESKYLSKVPSEFDYTLQFPGDREKFEAFIKRMNLQDHKVSDDEYKREADGGGMKATFSPDRKGFEIEFSSWKI
ncbi:hypothetical protein OVA24_07190 [Luteolibacter sp. SL250]|uniref:hypothetical protein n=1 Tax=Luteolibacter sp. SL250 TaxID=2995170 RepID=UPI00226D9D12|nr:hypothetical protein [Luteolibacter sp. SL250]WAC21166.1 hypothetical protein OVA24_07190 [Luteolibacter sp. SL250]